MASRRDKRVADATTQLGRTIAGAIRSWAKEVGAGDIASDVMDRVREGFDVVRDHAAAGQARTKARRAAKKAGKSAAKKAAKKAPVKGRTAASRKTTRKTTSKKTVRKKE